MADPENQLTDVEKDDLAGTMKNSASLRSLHSAESLESSDVEGKDDDDVPPEFNRTSTASSVSVAPTPKTNLCSCDAEACLPD